MSISFGRWCHRNLFSTPANTILTTVTVPLCIWLTYVVVRWTFVEAQWHVVTDNLRVLLIGTYPVRAVWRVWIATATIVMLSGGTTGVVFPARHPRLVFIIGSLLGVAGGLAFAAGVYATAGTLACAAAAVFGWTGMSSMPRLARLIGPAWVIGIVGVCAVMAPVGTDRWGGLLLSVIVTIAGTLMSLPLGVSLAFGRRSRVISLSLCCAGYIEVIRSIPLISVLYWAWIIVPLVLPPSYYVADLVRGVVGFALFFAAYVAEYVRAGLQSVPAGQIEAGQSLGLNALDVNFEIVLPQALRAVIPALVGNLLDIFNNVPLVFIIGLTDFLNAGQTILANPQYSGQQYEVYAFLFMVYLVIGGVISFTARRLEVRMGLGVR